MSRMTYPIARAHTDLKTALAKTKGQRVRSNKINKMKCVGGMRDCEPVWPSGKALGW